jgi:hypothetical protein
MTMAPNETSAEVAPQELDDVVQGRAVSTRCGSYTRHPICASFPAMRDTDFVGLLEDIRVNDQHIPITLYDGQVLDGWHRLRACSALGREPRTVEFAGTIEEAAAFAFSLNAQRRHLSTGQRALLAVEHLLPQFEAEARKRQRAGKKAPNDLCVPGRTGPRSRHRASIDAATAAGVSPSSVERAKRVLTHGTAEEVAAVRSGTRGLRTVAKAVQQRTGATKTTATKPPATKATPTQATTTTTALTRIQEPAAPTPPDAATIAALEALNKDLHTHLAGWPGVPEFFIECIRTWELVAREHFRVQGPPDCPSTLSYDIEALTVGLPSEPMGRTPTPDPLTTRKPTPA